MSRTTHLLLRIAALAPVIALTVWSSGMPRVEGPGPAAAGRPEAVDGEGHLRVPQDAPALMGEAIPPAAAEAPPTSVPRPTTTVPPTTAPPPSTTTSTTRTSTTQPARRRPRTSVTTAPAVEVEDPTPQGAPGSHSWILEDDGVPARWNPCAPIRVAYNLWFAPPYALDDLRKALRELSAASGLAFREVGLTPYVPVADDDPDWPEGIDLVVAWVTPAQVPVLGGKVAGYGGPRRVLLSRQGQLLVTRGTLVIDGAQLVADRWTAGMRGGISHGNVLRHELGHVVGLGHVDDPTQLLDDSLGPASPNGYQAGDREGLRELGAAGGCLTLR